MVSGFATEGKLDFGLKAGSVALVVVVPAVVLAVLGGVFVTMRRRRNRSRQYVAGAVVADSDVEAMECPEL